MSERPTFTDGREVAATVLAPFVDGEVDQVLLVSTRFISAGSQRVEVRQLLPLVDPRSQDDRSTAEESDPAGAGAPADASGRPSGYTEFEPDAAILLETLAPRAAETEIFGALLEASASEVTARQRAMAAASENAGELIKKYSRIMNRARQDTITTEIMEIVGGAEALRAAGDEDEGALANEATG
jgi:F-type H+-transporting ATPase subunit gamma